MPYLSLILFTISTCGSPGPNNVMVMSSGVNYGLRRSIPHVVGINVGFPIMAIVVGLGLGAVLHDAPVVYDVLRPIGAAYLLYLAYRIATAPVTAEGHQVGRPLSVLQAALFQWVNPKAWVMVLGAVVTYAAASNSYSYFAQVLIIALVFFVFGAPCTSAWVCIGVSLKRVLAKPIRFRIFNVVMAALLVASVVPMLAEM